MAKTKKAARREAANPAESVGLTVNERILQECYKLYVDEERGLVKLGSEVGLTLLPPRKKITVLLIGNHSAGKSSFINWYIEEHVQKTAVAIETQGFSVVTSGKRRESLAGNATLKLFPQFKNLQQVEGVVDYLCTEISTSKQKHFGLVTFIDTPGLVDGDMKYPFDVNAAIVWLGGMADLVVVFFDPIGQALCKRTLSIVERLNDLHPDRIRFFLSKADTAGMESDRQRVLMQITQELCKRPGLNKAGFKMPAIFIPSLTGKTPKCENQIEELCQEIQKTINHNIQNSLNSLEKDAEEIVSGISLKLHVNQGAVRSNFRAWCWGLLLNLFSLLLLLLVAAPLLQKLLETLFNTEASLFMYTAYMAQTWDYIPWAYRFYVWSGSGIVSICMLLLAWKMSRGCPTLSRKQKKLLMEKHAFISGYIQKRKTQLYEDYLKQSVAALDMP